MALKRFPLELEYKRHPELSKQAVEDIMDWVEDQPHLPNISEEDAILFLTSCCHDIPKTKKTIDIYFTIRSTTPELFKNRDPTLESFEISSNIVYYLLFPGLTDDGCKVIYCCLKDGNPSEFCFATQMKRLLCLLDIMHHEDGAVKGFRVISDMKKCGVRHWAKISPTMLVKMLNYLQSGIPSRIRGVHFLNPVFFMGSIMNLVRPFLNQTVSQVISIHKNLDELHKIIPKTTLPAELGGELKQSIEEMHDATVAKMRDYKDWFADEETMRVQETLRPSSTKSTRNYLGFKRKQVNDTYNGHNVLY